jgi:hypothetical protein
MVRGKLPRTAGGQPALPDYSAKEDPPDNKKADPLRDRLLSMLQQS